MIMEITVQLVSLEFKAAGSSTSNAEIVNKMITTAIRSPTLIETSECTLHV